MKHKTFKEWKQELSTNPEMYGPEAHWIFDDWEYAREEILKKLEEMIELKR